MKAKTLRQIPKGSYYWVSEKDFDIFVSLLAMIIILAFIAIGIIFY